LGQILAPMHVAPGTEEEPERSAVDASPMSRRRETWTWGLGFVGLAAVAFWLGRRETARGGRSAGVPFTRARLTTTRRAAEALVDSLEQYYNGTEQAQRMLFDSWTRPWAYHKPKSKTRDEESAQHQTRDDDQRIKKLVDTMARALVTEDQTEFIIGTLGSSVAAGHDNCHYDSYENQLERTFGPVWAAAGMKLTAQNAGEGGGCGDDFSNQVYCVQQNVSPDVDIVHYSWTYFEAGSADDDETGAKASQESLIRWTQMMPKQPPVHVLNVGDWPEQPDVAQSDYYSQFSHNTLYMRAGHALGGNFLGGLIYENGHVGDGYHNTTRYGLAETDPDRRESLGVVMRNWHPGPLGFELAADAFSYVYTKAVLAALDLIEKTLDDGEDPAYTWSQRKMVLKGSLQTPKHCNPDFCTVDEAPQCLNYEKPTFGYWGARVEDPNNSLNPHKGEVQNWEVSNEPNDWTYMVDKQDIAVFQDSEEKEKCKHLDACGGITATSPDDGRVVFRLPKMEVGLIVICGCCGKDVGTDMFLNNDRIEIEYNSVVLDRQTWDLWPNGKCVRLMQSHPATTSSGHAYLSVRVLEELASPIKISHLITL